ncbi:MAG: STAS domain-containing protein [Finegoldia sp.]|nr:STAS domain-containing protein [Finegoldia sp.]
MDLSYDIQIGDDISVKLKGDLDISTCAPFRDELLEKYEANKSNIIIDAADLEFLDSTGLGALIMVYNKAKEDGNNISIYNVKPHINKLFKITQMEKIFDIKEG